MSTSGKKKKKLKQKQINPTSSYKLDLTEISLQANVNLIHLSKINC